LSERHLIIGFGTGRSGTTSLSAFLNTQDRVCILHEGRRESRIPGKPFAWTGDEANVLQWIEELTTQNTEYDWVGDIGMYYINYVDVILQRFPGTRFICMQRTCNAVVSSYMKWTRHKNHWMVHDGTQWSPDPKWDKAFPKFPAASKEEALRMYWTSYAQQTKDLHTRFPERVKVVHLEDFNNKECRESILDFIQYTGPRFLDNKIERNSLKQKSRRRRRKRLAQAAWTLKRMLIGRPGDRWFNK
jgi:hypothetical protein